MSQGLFLNGRTPALPYPLRPCNGKHKDKTTIKKIRMEGNTKKILNDYPQTGGLLLYSLCSKPGRYEMEASINLSNSLSPKYLLLNL